MVFLVAWSASAIGAVMVYGLARRYGRSIFTGRLGRKLLSPHAVATIEREYLRFGIVGIFIGRLIPGVRSFVAPFAGIVNLSPLKALVPMILASGIWYGALTIAGATLGAEWESISRFISGLNRTLAYAGGAVALLIIGLLVMRRFRRREERLLASITRAFGARASGAHPQDEEAAMAAAATLMMELARADETLTPAELDTVADYLKQRWEVEPVWQPAQRTSLIERAKLLEYANQLTRDYQKAEREALVSRLWRAAFSDGALNEHEDRLMRRAGLVLGLSEDEVERAREQARTSR
jgi:membrane protein DedA with SNARE-associated domain